MLLWNFFADSPADKEWRVLHSYWGAERERQAAVAAAAARERGSGSEGSGGGGSRDGGGGGGGGEVRAERFEAMEGEGGGGGFRGTWRPLAFEEGKFAVLESELKALYCALTRARINVWVVDFDREKRGPAFRCGATLSAPGLTPACTPFQIFVRDFFLAPWPTLLPQVVLRSGAGGRGAARPGAMALHAPPPPAMHTGTFTVRGVTWLPAHVQP